MEWKESEKWCNLGKMSLEKFRINLMNKMQIFLQAYKTVNLHPALLGKCLKHWKQTSRIFFPPFFSGKSDYCQRQKPNKVALWKLKTSQENMFVLSLCFFFPLEAVNVSPKGSLLSSHMVINKVIFLTTWKQVSVTKRDLLEV